MKRVLVLIYARQVNVNVIDFASYMAQLTHSKLTGVLFSLLFIVAVFLFV